MDASYLRSSRENALDGQVLAFNATQARFLPTFAAGFDPSTTVQQLFVTTTGSDLTGDGSQSNPFATPQKAADTLGPFGVGVVHMASGTYPRPILRNLCGPVVFVGDGAGVPGDDGLTVVQAATAAGVGTSGDAIVGAFVANAQRYNAIQFISGAAAGQRRNIIDNDVTTLTPYSTFSPAPVAGDLYRIVTPAVIWDSFVADEIWIQNCGSRGYALTSVATPESTYGRIYLVNIAPSPAAGPSRANIVDSSVLFAGVDGNANFRLSLNSSNIFSGESAFQDDPTLAFLLGLSVDQYRGYGLAPRCTSSVSILGSNLQGYLVFDALLVGSSTDVITKVDMTGGALRQSLTLSSGAVGSFFPSNTPSLLVQGPVTALTCTFGSNVTIGTGAIFTGGAGDGIRVNQGGRVRSSGGAVVTTTTGNAVNASQSGQFYLTSDPAAGTWTGGSAAFRVSATETAVVGAFAAVDGTLAAAIGNGSIITRVS